MTGARPCRAPLPGYAPGISVPGLLWLLTRLVLSLYLVASALAGFDVKRLLTVEIVLRLALAVAVLTRPQLLHLSAIFIAFGVIAWHYWMARQTAAVEARVRATWATAAASPALSSSATVMSRYRLSKTRIANSCLS